METSFVLYYITLSSTSVLVDRPKFTLACCCHHPILESSSSHLFKSPSMLLVTKRSQEDLLSKATSDLSSLGQVSHKLVMTTYSCHACSRELDHVGVPAQTTMAARQSQARGPFATTSHGTTSRTSCSGTQANEYHEWTRCNEYQ